jgi:hypothetical protein
MRAPVPDFDETMGQGVVGLRAEWVTFYGTGTEAATLAAIRAAGEVLAELGMDLVDGGDIPPLPPDASASHVRFVGDFLMLFALIPSDGPCSAPSRGPSPTQRRWG